MGFKTIWQKIDFFFLFYSSKQQFVQQYNQRHCFWLFLKVRHVNQESEFQTFLPKKLKQTNFLLFLSPVWMTKPLLDESMEELGSDVNSLPWLPHLLLHYFLLGLFTGVRLLSAEGLGAAGRHLLCSWKFLWRLKPSELPRTLLWTLPRDLLRTLAWPSVARLTLSFILLFLFSYWPLNPDCPALQLGAVQFQCQLHWVCALQKDRKDADRWEPSTVTVNKDLGVWGRTWKRT